MQIHVDVAAGGQNHRGAGIVDQSGAKGRDANGSGPFDDLLVIVIGGADAVRDLGFIHQNKVIGQICTHIECILVVLPDAAAKAVGQCRQFFDRGRFAFLQACDHRTAAFHRNADNPDRRID